MRIRLPNSWPRKIPPKILNVGYPIFPSGPLYYGSGPGDEGGPVIPCSRNAFVYLWYRVRSWRLEVEVSGTSTTIGPPLVSSFGALFEADEQSGSSYFPFGPDERGPMFRTTISAAGAGFAASITPLAQIQKRTRPFIPAYVLGVVVGVAVASTGEIRLWSMNNQGSPEQPVDCRVNLDSHGVFSSISFEMTGSYNWAADGEEGTDACLGTGRLVPAVWWPYAVGPGTSGPFPIFSASTGAKILV